MRKLRFSSMIGLFAVTSLMSASAFADATVSLTNDSSFSIHQLFISPTATDEWGPDQLGEDILAADGGVVEITEVPCDTYDVKLVDEDGDECTVMGVELCEDAAAVITDDALLECEGYEVE